MPYGEILHEVKYSAKIILSYSPFIKLSSVATVFINICLFYFSFLTVGNKTFYLQNTHVR